MCSLLRRPWLTEVFGSREETCRRFLSDVRAVGRDLAQHVRPALGGDLDAAVLGDVREGGAADPLALLRVVDEPQQGRLDLVDRTRVHAGDAVLDLRIDLGV